MDAANLKRALEIFEKYERDSSVRTEHDQLWCGPDEDVEMSAEDKAELEELGWFINEGSWSHFT